MNSDKIVEVLEKVNDVTIKLGNKKHTFSDRFPAVLTRFLREKYGDAIRTIEEKVSKMSQEAALIQAVPQMVDYIYKFLGIKFLVDQGVVKYREVISRQNPFTPEEIEVLKKEEIDPEIIEECETSEVVYAFYKISMLQHPFDKLPKEQREEMEKTVPFLIAANNRTLLERVMIGVTMMDQCTAQTEVLLSGQKMIFSRIKEIFKTKLNVDLSIEHIFPSSSGDMEASGK